MKKIMPTFKDERDKAITVTLIILSIFLFFIPSLLAVIFLKEQLSESAYSIAKGFFNFELMLFLVSLLFVIPIIGWIVGFILTPLMVILNVIIGILALCSIAKNTEIKLPSWYEFI